MKKKKLDLNKKLVLNKETVANLTPPQQAKLAEGWHPATAAITCLRESGQHTDCNCAGTQPNNCNPIASGNCAPAQSGYCPGASGNVDCVVQSF